MIFRRLPAPYRWGSFQRSSSVAAPRFARTVTYTLFTEVAGDAMFTGAIAALNDPFVFTGDPVQGVLKDPGQKLSLHSAVPERLLLRCYCWQ